MHAIQAKRTRHPTIILATVNREQARNPRSELCPAVG